MLAAFIFFAVFILTGVKSFSAWPQVMGLWQGSTSLYSLFGHPHLFRFLVAYPGLTLDAWLPEFGFSIYCSIFFFLNARLWADIMWRTVLVKPSLLGWCIFFGIHLLMNGRGVIAWSAWLMCVSLCLDLSRSKEEVKWLFLRIFLSGFLASVSTGVFVVVLASIVVFLVGGLHHRRIDFLNIRAGFVFCLGVPLAYMLISYFIVAINKNLDFYGGGIQGVVDMLGHGMGKFFLSIDCLNFLLPVIFFYCVFLIMVFAYLGIRLSPINKLLLISMVGGLFGFTVLTLAMPLILCGLEVVSRAVFRAVGLGHVLYKPRQN